MADQYARLTAALTDADAAITLARRFLGQAAEHAGDGELLQAGSELVVAIHDLTLAVNCLCAGQLNVLALLAVSAAADDDQGEADAGSSHTS